MARVHEGLFYRIRCMVGGTIMPPVTIAAGADETMEDAITAALLHFALKPEHEGAAVRVLGTSSIDPALL